MLNNLTGCALGCWMFYIRTEISNTNAPARKAFYQLVHESQVASELPSNPSLLDRRSRLLYTKHFIPFSQAKAVLSDPSDKYRIIKHVRDALRARMALTREYWTDCCRFHLRVEQDGCLFVIVSLATDAKPTQWMAEMLSNVLERHMISRTDLPPVSHRVFCPNEHIPCKPGSEVGALMLTACIRDLTPSLLNDILSHLDLHSQMKAKRVCALWQLLLSSSSIMKHISISLDSCFHLKADGDNCFKAASLLSRSINTTTVSLTLLSVPPPDSYYFLHRLLDVMEIKLPILVLKDHTNLKPIGCYREKQSRLKHGVTSDITLHKHICTFILLQNWKVANLFGRQMYEVFEESFYYEPHSGVTTRPLPAHERNCMLRLSHESQELAIDQLQITIPKLLLPCSESKMHMTSRLMCALNDNFPPVTEEMLAKVVAVRARWLRTLSYPDDWQSIRNYLLFQFFRPSDFAAQTTSTVKGVRF
ncbi:uncharacterized protein LOC129602448 isoform X2 [Paramacrobiotus metropolitanus]|uniref:uncharacterized protein LOC129602448 isoform X2 n=1 Tax=Paramacrobiotus metropolitanus TaxID=2943436 RepID=UPI002445A8BA|nr:uncharacterized protein LOC129602448 isoform X2 [Paramacrobiotus metropolitanus]